MRKYMKWLFISFFLFNISEAKVTPPNYDFSLEQLQDFYPGKNLTELRQKLGNGEKLKTVGETELYRYFVDYYRYKFPVVVQVDKEKVLDMLATMPSYFLHDIFHQGLINKWGKQSIYKRHREEAYYQWNEIPDFDIAYSASCTITCFPIFLSLSIKASRAPSGFVTQLKMLEQHSNNE